MEKSELSLGSRGAQGMREIRFGCIAFFCVPKANLLLTPLFFFGINIGFVIPQEESWEDDLHRVVKFMFYM